MGVAIIINMPTLGSGLRLRKVRKTDSFASLSEVFQPQHFVSSFTHFAIIPHTPPKPLIAAFSAYYVWY